MNGRFDGLRKDVTVEMNLIGKRMVIRLGGMIVAGIGFLAMLGGLFPVVPAAGIAWRAIAAG